MESSEHVCYFHCFRAEAVFLVRSEWLVEWMRDWWQHDILSKSNNQFDASQEICDNNVKSEHHLLALSKPVANLIHHITSPMRQATEEHVYVNGTFKITFFSPAICFLVFCSAFYSPLSRVQAI